MVFLKWFFKKVNFEKDKQETKIHEKSPSMQSNTHSPSWSLIPGEHGPSLKVEIMPETFV